MTDEQLAWYFVGIMELDGSFVFPSPKTPRFQMFQPVTHLDLLKKFRNYLGAGIVTTYQAGRSNLGKKPRAHIRIDGNEVIQVLIPFLDAHPFIGPKAEIYNEWRKKAITMIR